jgi:hypothetical protein
VGHRDLLRRLTHLSSFELWIAKRNGLATLAHLWNRLVIWFAWIWFAGIFVVDHVPPRM